LEEQVADDGAVWVLEGPAVGCSWIVQEERLREASKTSLWRSELQMMRRCGRGKGL